MEERDEEMNAMFHLVLSGHEGFGRAVRGGEGAWGGAWKCVPLPPNAKAAVTQDFRCPAPSTGLSVQLLRNRRPKARYVDMWQSVTVMVDNGPSTPIHTHTHALTLRQLRDPSHRALERRMNDGFAIDKGH